MSLKRSEATAGFSFPRKINNKRESGKPGFGFPLFRASPGLWECGNRVVCDFQGLWETMGNRLLVFLVFHSPSFPQPFCRSYFMRFYSDRSWQTAFVFLAACSAPQRCRWYGPLSGSIALPSAPASGTVPDPPLAAESPRASHTIDTLFSACLWPPSPLPELRTAGEVQVEIEVLAVELVERFGMRPRNVPISHVLPQHRSILTLRQAVIIRMPRPR